MSGLPGRVAAFAFAAAAVVGLDAVWSAGEAPVLVAGQSARLAGLVPGDGPPVFVAPPGTSFAAGPVSPDAWLGRPTWHGVLRVDEATPGPAALEVTAGGATSSTAFRVVADPAEARAWSRSSTVRFTGLAPAPLAAGLLGLGLAAGAVATLRGRARWAEAVRRGEVPAVVVVAEGTARTRVAFLDLVVGVGDEVTVVRPGDGARWTAPVVELRDGATWAELPTRVTGPLVVQRSSSCGA